MKRLNSEVPRHSRVVAREILEDSPMLVVQGARQVGKSTLLRQVLSEHDSVFVTLDDPAMQDFARLDPRGFVEQAPGRTLAIDEAQRVPDLALALKAAIDEDRRPGRFAITGSADLLRVAGVSDSLAGRAESLVLGGLSHGEILELPVPEDWVTWIRGLPEASGASAGVDDEVRQAVLAGGYPEPLSRETRRRSDRWFDSYVERIATHDARELGTPSFAHHLPALLRSIASTGHAELVKAKIARQLGLSEAVLSTYLDAASVMYLTETLPSWGVGFSGREVRRPKLCLKDSGLATALSGLTLEMSRRVGGRELFGALLESYVVGELRKQQSWSDTRFRLFHYRQRETEIDLVIECGDGQVIFVEVKSARDVSAKAARNMELVTERMGADAQRVIAHVVLSLSETRYRMNRQVPVYFLPVSSLWDHGSLTQTV